MARRGRGGIRTLEGFHPTRFRDGRTRPLCDPSGPHCTEKGRDAPTARLHTSVRDTRPVATTTSHVRDEPTRFYWTLDDYHAAVDAGVFGDQRVELLHGELIEMPPMSEPHIAAVRYLAGIFYAAIGWQRAASQTPIILPSDGEPEPDVAVFESGAPIKPARSRVTHAGMASVLWPSLVPEVTINLDEVFEAARLTSA